MSVNCGRTLLLQKLGGEIWAYNDPVAVFIADQLLGSLTEFLHWAADSFGYNDHKPIAMYQTVATQAYNDHICSPEVCNSEAL